MRAGTTELLKHIGLAGLSPCNGEKHCTVLLSHVSWVHGTACACESKLAYAYACTCALMHVCAWPPHLTLLLRPMPSAEGRDRQCTTSCRTNLPRTQTVCTGRPFRCSPDSRSFGRLSTPEHSPPRGSASVHSPLLRARSRLYKEKQKQPPPLLLIFGL